MEALLHMAARTYVGVGKRADPLPQPSSSAPPRIALEQAGDLYQIEQPQELRLPDCSLEPGRIGYGEVQQRARDRRGSDAADDADFVRRERSLEEPDAWALLGSCTRRDLREAVIRAQVMKARGRPVARHGVAAGRANRGGQPP